MKANLFSVLLFFVFIVSHAQINFEKGYFINNDGNRVDCLIKNKDWNDNPRQFDYKISETSKVNTTTIDQVSEFGILDLVKFERHSTKIDRSSDITAKLSGNREPAFESKTIFLKVLVEGGTDLFLYVDNDITRFYYQVKNQDVVPLVYKRFLRNELYKEQSGISSDIGFNMKYKQQLKSNINCNVISDNKFYFLNYNESSLIPYFVNHNKCEKSPTTLYKLKKNKDWVDVKIRLGLNHSSFSVGKATFSSPTINGDYGTDISPRYGLEFEFFLPVNNRKWSGFVEASYQEFKAKKDGELTFAVAEYKTIELPVGFRHYIFFTDKSKLFLNVSVAFVFNKNSKIDLFRTSSGNMISTRNLNGTEEYFSFGTGYNWNDKISLEFRYNTNRDLLGDTRFYTSRYGDNFSVLLGYSFF